MKTSEENKIIMVTLWEAAVDKSKMAVEKEQQRVKFRDPPEVSFNSSVAASCLTISEIFSPYVCNTSLIAFPNCQERKCGFHLPQHCLEVRAVLWAPSSQLPSTGTKEKEVPAKQSNLARMLFVSLQSYFLIFLRVEWDYQYLRHAFQQVFYSLSFCICPPLTHFFFFPPHNCCCITHFCTARLQS